MTGMWGGTGSSLVGGITFGEGVNAIFIVDVISYFSFISVKAVKRRTTV